MTILLTIVLGVLLSWLAGLFLLTDFSIPSKGLPPLQRVLVIFPHADDEAMNCGGFLHRMADQGSAITLVILTKGERGNPDASYDEQLKGIRTREAQAASSFLRISRLVQEDFGDGLLHEKREALTSFISAIIEQEKPDLLITYDLAGLYGHSDHIVCSEIITELHRSRFPEPLLWYVTMPKRMLARMTLPEHLAGDRLFREKQSLPTRKVFIGLSIFQKLRAANAYKSQQAAFTQNGNKYIALPLFWLFLSLMLFEYFAEIR